MFTRSSGMPRWFASVLVVVLASLAAASVARGAQGPVFVWHEGEEPTSANFKFTVQGGPKGNLLSGGKWLHIAIDQKDIAAQVPAEGLLLSYGLQAPEAGDYELWARVGYEWVRPPFEWRIGDGEWKPASNEMQTTNVMSLTTWVEVGWLNLGSVTLPAGPALLQLRYKKGGSDGRMLVALDCVALVRGHFVPEGVLKPGETYDGAADRKAAAQIFQLPVAPGGAPGAAGAGRASVKLSGPWQVARYDDPDMDAAPYAPVAALPDPAEYPLRWMGIDVPGTLWAKDETAFAHRVIYRTSVDVPAHYEGRAFTLHFSGTNWLASIFVNGRLAGTHNVSWVPWDLDVTPFVKTGAVNEIAVAIKGPYYAFDVAHMERGDLDHLRNRPTSALNYLYWVTPIYPSGKGDGDGVDYGIVNPVTLSAVGRAYCEDVFVRPSVARHQLDADVTVRNSGAAPSHVQVRCDAVYDRDGTVAKSFGPVELDVPAGQDATVTVSGPWADPKLWWPVPNPDLYRLRTTVSEQGEPLDVSEELFGFREVTVDGTAIRINGVRRNFWCWVEPHGGLHNGEDWAKAFRAENDRFIRFGADLQTATFLPSREEQLEFYDRNGIPGRLCSMIDGMFISYALGDAVKDPKTNQQTFEPNKVLWENFRQHVAAMTHAYRNHPSVLMYQAENELVYINGQNRYSYGMDRIQEETGKILDAGRANDRTRPYFVGGGGDLGGRADLNCPHYPEGSMDWYPENAYTIAKVDDHVARWPWKHDKPWISEESAFAMAQEFGAYVIGDDAFRSALDAQRGKAAYLRMLYDGYRWAGAAGFCPWDNLYQYEDSQKMFSDLAVIPRKQTSRLFAGRSNQLLFKVMNDTFSAEPVKFEWSYEAGGKRIAGGSQTLKIEAGFGQEVTLAIDAPATQARLDGQLKLRASQPGAPDFVDVRSVPVLPAVAAVQLAAPLTVLDRSGKLKPFLDAAHAKFDEVQQLADLKGRSGLIAIGPDTLTPQEAFGQDLLKFALGGGRVLVLEQDNPVGGANLPVSVQTTSREGGYAHPQALGTPLFRDLDKDDLIDWAGDHPTYKDPYMKPAHGARSLAQAGDKLQLTPLLEAGCGQGVLALCQLRVGAKLQEDPAAAVLLRNLLETYSAYKAPQGVAAVYSPGNRLLSEEVAATGLLTRPVAALKDALQPQQYRVAVVEASPTNLQALAGLSAEAAAFEQAGGWIMLCGLTPDGLAAFGRVTGTQHQLRPFRLERATMENPGYALAATLGNRDLVMFTTNGIQSGKMWISGDAFSYVIDAGSNVAPFCRLPGGPEDPYAYESPRDSEHPDQNPWNLVNGLLNSDNWRYIRQIWVPDGGPEPLVFGLRRPETLSQINIWNNANYWTINDVDVILDGDEAHAVKAQLPDSFDLTEIKFPEPRTVQKTVALRIRTWREGRGQDPKQRLVGIDNVQFIRAARPSDAVSIDSTGGLVAFPKGTGGIFLNQIKFMEKEQNPENAVKKSNLLSVILQNMGVGAEAAAVAVPGLNVKYAPVDIMQWCNGYMTEKDGRVGWFGQKNQDLRNLPIGDQYFADVLYHVVDYVNAPVPNCILLGTEWVRKEDLPLEVKGVKVGRKADVLFFLHAAGITYPISAYERPAIIEDPSLLPEAARYVLHYADGKTAVIPVVLERDVDGWLREKADPLQGAAVAWTQPIQSSEGKVTVLYSMKALNPRPDVEIATIDVLAGKRDGGGNANRCLFGLVAVTLGTVQNK